MTKKEFIDELATQLTESYYGEETYVYNYIDGEEQLVFSEQANRMFNDKYYEIETMYDSIQDIETEKNSTL